MAEPLVPSLGRVGLSAALVFGILTATGPAAAQTVTLPTAQPTRKVPLRGSSQKPYAVSYSDCEADDVYTFSVTLTGYAGYTLEVWAGPNTDCTDVNTRTGTAPTCWKVYTGQPTNKLWTVNVRVQDMIGMHTVANTPNGPGSGTAADCDVPTSSAPQTLSLNFMLVDGSGQLPSGEQPAKYPLVYDLVGPTPPTNVSAGVGDGQLVLNWTASNDTDLLGYDFYCDPPPGGAATATGGTGGSTGTGGSATDAGTDAATATGGFGAFEGGTSNPACPSTALVEGQRPPAAYKCGSVTGQTNSSGNATGLTNSTPYAVAVAGYDTVGNAGPLSNVACATPEPVSGFFDLYRKAGGKGGGGFCGIAGKPAPGAFWGFGGVLLAMFWRRRRRQRR